MIDEQTQRLTEARDLIAGALGEFKANPPSDIPTLLAIVRKAEQVRVNAHAANVDVLTSLEELAGGSVIQRAGEVHVYPD